MAIASCYEVPYYKAKTFPMTPHMALLLVWISQFRLTLLQCKRDKHLMVHARSLKGERLEVTLHSSNVH